MGDLVSFESLTDISPLAQQALNYAAAGFYVFPVWGLLPDLGCACPEHGNCGSPGKHPLVKSGLNASTTSPEQIRKWWRKHPFANIGINAERSGLLILDVDPRNGGDATLAGLEKKHGDLPATYEVRTGGGGQHFYFKYLPAVKSKPVGSGLDIKSKGGYVVAPPSSHHSGRSYEALHLGDPRGFILEPPPWLVDLCTKDPVKLPGPKTGKPSPVESGLFGAAFKHAGWLGEDLGGGRSSARCPFETEHTSGNAYDGSTVIFAPEKGGVNGFLHCSHSHCTQRPQPEFWKAIPSESRDAARALLSVNPLYEPAATADADWLASWRSSLLFDSAGKLKRVLGNASLILKNHPAFAGCLGYDEFKESYCWLRAPPAIQGLSPVPVGPVRDEHFLQIGYWLASRYDLQDFSSDHIFQIMRGAAVPFHPVRDYLRSVVWDQHCRVCSWLTDYLGVPDTPYSRAVGAWWLISAVARVLQPGCKADHVLILEGPQGTRKSTALRTLATPWFADTPINLDSKDAYTALRGVWIYELQELQSLSKADSDKAKAFFSSPVDIYRKPYDRTTVEIKRQCVFGGSVNYDAYLKDSSGNRRYWPIVTNNIDIVALTRDRDQLWAEAVHMFQLGAQWYPVTPAEQELCAVEQDLRLQLDEDPWMHAVRSHVTGKSAVRVHEILSDPINFPGCRKELKDAIRVARCLRELGWTKHTVGGGKEWRSPEWKPSRSSDVKLLM
jgi:hypothetical protein